MSFYEFESDICNDENLPIYMAINTIKESSSIKDIHWHDVIELLYSIEGTATAVLNGQSIKLAPNELVIINSNKLHTLYSEDGCEYVCMHIQPKVLTSFGLPNLEIKPHINDLYIKDSINKVISSYNSKEYFYMQEIKALIIKMFIYLYRNCIESNEDIESIYDKKHFELVKEIIRYVRIHFVEEISIDEICKSVAFSPSHISHCFKAVTGQTLMKYINYVRCENAKYLLKSGEHSVQDCAELCGFTTLSYFSRIYKQQMGVPPSADLKHK